jgi:hypothetical protein
MDMDSDGHWLTYEAAALALGITKSSVRQKAIRGKLRRMHDNTGRALVLVPDTVRDNATDNATDGVSNRVDTPTRTPSVHVTFASALNELKAQLKAADERETRLVTQLAAAEARAGEEAAKTAQAIAAFEQLAQRLEAIAEARRPWWRRLRMTG